MKMCEGQTSRKSGGVLVMVVLVMLLITTMVAGMLKLQQTSGVESIYMKKANEAFWRAEEGVLTVIQLIGKDDVWRDAVKLSGSGIVDITNAPGDVLSSVNVEFVGVISYPAVDHDVFEITSTGYAGPAESRVQKSVWQRIETYPSAEYAIIGGRGDVDIGPNTLINGPLAIIDGGNLILDDRIPPGQSEEGDYDIVILDQDATIDGSSNAIEGQDYGVVDLPPPDLPEMPDFSGEFTNAVTLGTAPTNTSLGNLVLNGTTNYYTTNITVSGISGGGTIVSTGDITILGGDHVDADINIISGGDIIIGNHYTFDGDALIYAWNAVDVGGQTVINNSSSIYANGSQTVDIPVSTDIKMGTQSQFEGLIYASHGIVVIDGGSGQNVTRVEGSVVGAEGVTVDSGCEVILNPDYAGGAGSGSTRVDPQTWMEL